MRNLSISFRIVSAPLRPRTVSVIPSTASPFSIRSYHNHSRKTVLPLSRQNLLKAGSATAILGSFFSTSSKSQSDRMSYPDKRSEEEWRAVLSPGISITIPSHPISSPAMFPNLEYETNSALKQNNSASSAKKALNDPTPANTTPTTQHKESTPALAAARRYT